MEWWSNGVMKEPIQIKIGLSFLPTLQCSNTPKELAPVPAKPLYSDLALRTRLSIFNNRQLKPETSKRQYEKLLLLQGLFFPGQTLHAPCPLAYHLPITKTRS
jgi:hypothetical protein